MATRKRTSQAQELVHVASLHRANLLGALRAARESQGLTQDELAQRADVARMTVQRAEAEGADASLSTFLELTEALNLQVHLGEPEAEVTPHPRDLIHRGLAYNRTKHDLEWRDRQREAALAKSWEAANEHRDFGLSAILPTMIPGVTQAQATAVATAMQWLGSEVGFEFLTRALEHAGYAIHDTKSAAAKKRTGK